MGTCHFLKRYLLVVKRVRKTQFFSVLPTFVPKKGTDPFPDMYKCYFKHEEGKTPDSVRLCNLFTFHATFPRFGSHVLFSTIREHP